MPSPNRNNVSEYLIQFAKWPEPGRVKTRLAVSLGDEGALAAHIELTCAVLGNLVATGKPLTFWWDRAEPDDRRFARPILDRLADAGVGQVSQTGSDLGERMSRALATGLASASRAVIVGSDCPSVDPDYIEQAFASLLEADVVLGPSDDGGFVLIGSRRDLGGCLQGINWGTDLALSQTVEALRRRQLTVVELAPRWDVDEPEDWTRFLELRETRQRPDGSPNRRWL